MSRRSATDTRVNVENRVGKNQRVLGELYHEGTIVSSSAEKLNRLVGDDAKHVMFDTPSTESL